MTGKDGKGKTKGKPASEEEKREIERVKQELDRWIKETIVPLIEAQANRLKEKLPRDFIRPYLEITSRNNERKDLVAAFGENFQMLNLFLSGLSNRRKHELFLDLRGLLVRYIVLSDKLPKFSSKLSMESLPYEEMPVLESFEDILALIDDQLYNIIEIAENKREKNGNCPDR